MSNDEHYAWEDEQAPNWGRIHRELSAPFGPLEVEWRLDSKPTPDRTRRGVMVARVLGYTTRAAIVRRLDRVVGPQNWEYLPEPLARNGSHVVQVLGRLTIHGVTKGSYGTARDVGTVEGAKLDKHTSKGADADGLKRVAAVWDMGLELTDLPTIYAEVEGNDIHPDAERELGRRLLAWALTGCKPGAFDGSTVYATRGQQGQQQSGQARQSQAQASGQGQQAASPRPATPSQPAQPQAPVSASSAPQAANEPPATEQQVVSLRKLAQVLGRAMPEGLTYNQARKLLTDWSAEYQRRKRAAQPQPAAAS